MTVNADNLAQWEPRLGRAGIRALSARSQWKHVQVMAVIGLIMIASCWLSGLPLTGLARDIVLVGAVAQIALIVTGAMRFQAFRRIIAARYHVPFAATRSVSLESPEKFDDWVRAYALA